MMLSLAVLALPLVARGLAEAFQRRARRDAWTELDQARTADPFRGYKIAQLIVGADRAWLAGVTSLRYGVDELAQCRRRTCRPPGLDCRCGFYAFRDRDRAVELLRRLTSRHPARSYVLLTTDLDGDVLEYELGFRAERQRVLRIDVPGACVSCLRRDRVEPATSIVVHPHFRGEQLLYERTLSARMALPAGSAPVRPVCEEHAPDDRARRVDLLELRERIGTEVAMLPVGELADGEQAA